MTKPAKTTYIRPTQKSTKLGTTDVEFTVYDNRGKNGYPTSQEGYVFVHREHRSVPCIHTGQKVKRRAYYAVTTNSGAPTDLPWQVDQIRGFGPNEVIYGAHRATHFATNTEAAAVLSNHLDAIAKKATLGG